ncbi:queuosine precursor transporter [Leucobacter rhizosphaerae]|uniref:Probable queuosine precursor transporter n=1 Tax=Leucobacter rhizosphaerae TaxID=2932245 RepID=A0ABY4FXW0_9MICO|nr:queuosine precursor transporter [Leucobacter rhizosphaerae]UOQ61136.1 queuosine precursor transporter [Leucobacter rhizosphaerae]
MSETGTIMTGAKSEQTYATPGARSAASGSRYAVIVATFVGLLLISNIVAVKLIAFGPFIVDGGVFLFPLVYIVGDVLAEVYGLKAARRAILTAFALSLLTSLTIWVTQLSPAAAGWENQEAFESVLGFVPRIVAASLGAFLAGQFINAWVLVKLRERTSGRFLRTRLIGSTLVGQLVDTIVFCTIAFWGVIEGWDFIGYTALGYGIKVLAEIVLLPITTRVISRVRRAEELTAR